MGRLPRRLSSSGDNPLGLDEKEKETLVAFDLEMLAIQKKKIAYLREIAREKGITASNLEDLKSESGESFREEKSDNRTWGHEYRSAVVLRAPGGSPHIAEMAYLCHSPYLKDDPDSCGWVKGIPVEKEYNDIGFLSGSAGVRYYCKICGKQIGEHRLVVS